jgi:hypothetical protein
MSDEPRGPGPSTIERCIAAWQRAQAALANDDALQADEGAIASALDSDPFLLPPDELLRRIVRALNFAVLRKAEATELVGMMQAREMRYERRALALRTELFEVMVALNRQSFPAPEGTVSLRAGKESVLITDEDAIPDEYMITSTTRAPDRKAILADLREGVVIDGAALSNGAPSLVFRRQRSIAADAAPVAADTPQEPEQD